MSKYETDWDVTRTRNGVPEVSSTWLHENLENVRLVDIREPFELVGPLKSIDGATNIPLRELLQAASTWERDKPIVLVCRSASRTGYAAPILEEIGFSQVASLAGGMIEWNVRGFSTT